MRTTPRQAHRRSGFVLVSVLWLSLAIWLLLSALLLSSLMHYRMAVAAQRGAAASAAAEQALASRLSWAVAEHAASGAWPGAVVLNDQGNCELVVVEVVPAVGWWRLAIEASFEGVGVRREGTVHLP